MRLLILDHCRGAHIYNKLIDFIRSEYYKRGFQEVVSPNIYNSKLWQTSGHWEHYSDAMFKFESEKEMFGLKPMNCPGHCLIFDHGVRSWKVMNKKKHQVSTFFVKLIKKVVLFLDQQVE